MALLTSGNHVTHTSSGTGVGDPGGWREQEPALKTETEKGMTLMETQTESRLVSARPTGSNERSKLIEQYGCGPVQLTGTNDALYERHLVFDNVMEAAAIGARERFEAVARSVRDVLSQRWIRTEKTYERKDPKRVYYLSMEFLIGRSLANNVTNLLLDDITKKAVQEEKLDWYELLEQEPDAGLGNGGLGRLAACFLDSMATMEIPAMGYGLRYRIRYVQANHPGRLATRSSRQLAASS